MEDTNITRLRMRYEEAPSEGPNAKRVKFSHIHDQLQQFNPAGISAKATSKLIRDAFPLSYSKKLHHDRSLYVFGIQPTTVSSGPSQLDTSEGTEATLAREQHKSLMLQEEVEHLRLSVRKLEDEKQEMQSRIQKLEEESSRQDRMDLAETLTHQIHRIDRDLDLQVMHGPDTVEHFRTFSMDTVITDLQTHAPDLYSLFMALGDVERNRSEGDDTTPVEKTRAIAALCTLLKARSARVKGIQLLLGFMLVARSTNRQVLTVLNHAGVCASYTSTWDYLRRLTTEARYQELVKTGHWMWVYDNLNIQHKIRHEREDHHSTMLNLTARLAVNIRYLPDWDVDWSDSQPQKSRQSLTISDFLPSEADAQELQKRAVRYMMEFMVTEFESLADLKDFVPAEKFLHPPTKSAVVPMKVLQKDEKYTSETIDILTQLMTDAELTGTPQTVVGDQLTCKVIRSCKLWRQIEVDPKDRLSWAHEVPGDFHYLWECLRVIYTIFWGSPSAVGSLSNFREYIQRLRVDKSVKVFSIGDEFILHTFKAHLIASICSALEVSSCCDSITHERTYQWLQTKAESLVAQLLMPEVPSDPVLHFSRSFLHLGFLYLDLRHAIRTENGPHIIRHWKWWLPRFLGTGCKNYALESINLIANITADFPRHISYIVTHNRTVNMEGRPGRGKPIDQLIEHYNLVMKESMRSSGANMTTKHLEEISLSSLFLMEAAKKADQVFGVHPQSTAHTVRDAKKDIQKMATHLLSKKATIEVPGRSTPPFHDLTEDGWKKLSSTDWIKNTLSRSSLEDLQVDEAGEIDLSYELYDVV